MTIDEYKENHDYDEFDGEEICCHLCGADYHKMFLYKGKWWCEDCLDDMFYVGDDDYFDETLVCGYCGEPISGKVYQDKDTDEYYCEECFFESVAEPNI